MTLLDELMPRYDVSARYRTHVRTDSAAVYEALSRADVAGSPLIRMLFLLRRLPARLRLDSTRDPAADSAHRRTNAVAQRGRAVGCGP
jgi:hypothetical protein